MIIVKKPEKKDWASICKRPSIPQANLQSLVNKVFAKVKTSGDKAVANYTKQFDKVALSELRVSEAEMQKAIELVPKDLKKAIQLAAETIQKFHKAQTPQKIEVETASGVVCWQEARAIERIGIYIPGGTAPLFSTVLMLAIPAVIAGCNEIVLCTPPDKNGNINPAILYAANYVGVTSMYKVGGIQAIAAMAYGTAKIPQVNKIFGPGNQYVTAAKQHASQLGVAIDMPAGPSELLVLADETANPAFVASDLLSQAEHGADSQVICVVTSEKLIAEIAEKIEQQIKVLPRKDIATQAINNSKFIFLHKDQDCIDFINEYAPEHFIICSKKEDFYIQNIRNAGSVFIGNYTPESAGDYASGTNHTLPTNGYAKSYSGVNLDAFLKKITFQKITPKGIQNIGPSIELMAEAEGLQAHKNAVTLRLKNLEND